MSAATATELTTYAQAHGLYRAAGWRSPLPLPAGHKGPPPDGFTGWHGADPSGADSQTWIDDYPEYRDTTQLALRMPDDVVGIDVDHYGSKRGADTMREAVKRWGPLPDAPHSSARGEGPAGIYLFAIPAGTALRTKIGFPELSLGDVEIIQHHHRYAVVWPSLNPHAQLQPYLWYGTDSPHRPPVVAELPDLPDRWLQGLAGAGEPGEAAADPETVAAFAREHSGGAQEGAIRGVLSVFERDSLHGTRHDAMLSAVCMGAREARMGRYSAAEVRGQLRHAFTLALTSAKPGQRLAGPAEARREFDSMWAWGVSQALAVPMDELLARRTPVSTPGSTKLEPRRLELVPAQGEVLDAEIVEGELEEPPSTWRPVDLSAILAGTVKAEPPAWFARTDGVKLLYPGKLHSFHGESESGKSWLALIAAVEVLAAGEAVLFIDHESDAATVVERLLLLGAQRDAVAARFVYVQPDQPIDPAEFPGLIGTHYALAVIDGVTDAISTEGYSSNNMDEISMWLRRVPRRVAHSTGAAVMLIDHVTKTRDNRGRFAVGSQQKMNGLSGAAYTVDVAVPFGRGMAGEIVVRIGKDRPGFVRPECGKASPLDRTAEVARVRIDSRLPGRILTTVSPWRGDGVDDGATPFRAALEWSDPMQVSVPDDIAMYTSSGAKSIKDLARFLRTHAVNGLGVDLPGARAALRSQRIDGKPRHDSETVNRAWGALHDMGRIKPSEANVSENARGLHWWVEKAGDPSMEINKGSSRSPHGDITAPHEVLTDHENEGS